MEILPSLRFAKTVRNAILVESTLTQHAVASGAACCKIVSSHGPWRGTACESIETALPVWMKFHIFKYIQNQVQCCTLSALQYCAILYCVLCNKGRGRELEQRATS